MIKAGSQDIRTRGRIQRRLKVIRVEYLIRSMAQPLRGNINQGFNRVPLDIKRLNHPNSSNRRHRGSSVEFHLAQWVLLVHYFASTVNPKLRLSPNQDSRETLLVW